MTPQICIIQTGVVSAIGNNCVETQASLIKGNSGIDKMRYLKSRHVDIPVGEVKMSDYELKASLGIGPDVIVGRNSLLGAYAIRECLTPRILQQIRGKRVALICGTSVGVMDVTEQYYERIKTDPSLKYLPRSNECGKSTEEMALFSGLDAAGADRIDCCTISTACSSALNAIIIGSEMLKDDKVDVVIAGGAESLSKFHLNGFNTLMILDRKRCRPFDDTRAGLNLGEGAGFVVIVKDAAPCDTLAYVTGYANRCDAYHQTASSPDGEGAYRAMNSALAMAGLEPKQIQYINAHGTGTPNNDPSESEAIKRIFGTCMPEVSSTKSFTGHTTSASGSIETIICILAMQGGFTPANLGWQEPIQGGIVPTLGHKGVTLENVLCNAFGFGGNDSSLIISAHPVDYVIPTERYESFKALSCRLTQEDDLSQLKEYVPVMESRRMCRIMKAALLCAMRTLHEAGIQSPDAIISATPKGMLENSTLFLEDVVMQEEELLKPTLFMQSTHNTISSGIAIRTHCHGYNTTYSSGGDSIRWALMDAEMKIEKGEAENVLVVNFDEVVEGLQTTSFYVECTLLKRKTI